MPRHRSVAPLVLAVLIAPALVAPAAAQTADYHAMSDRFFELVAEGKPTEAVDYVFGTNPWLTKVPDQLANVRSQFGNLESLVGGYVDREALVDSQVSDRYAYMYVLANYERQPIKVEFHFYRPDDRWMLFNFNFHSDIAEDLVGFALERNQLVD